MPDMKQKGKKIILPGKKPKPDDPMEKGKISPEAAAKIRKKAGIILGAGTEY